MKNTPANLYLTAVFEQGETFVNIKDVYNLVDCLSDLGGLIEIIMAFASMIIYPIAYHSFLLKAI